MRAKSILIKTIDNVENDYMLFSEIEVKDVFSVKDDKYITFIGFSYSYKIDDGYSHDISFANFSRLEEVLTEDKLYYIEDYIAKALYLNDINLLEEKSKYRLECYLKSYFYNN
jgi:hypothetical protein